MNKTININLGGMFFHIDEDAYLKLSRYFEAIKKQLSDSDGKDEIMSDIEIRISELFSEKLKSDKQVISLKDLDEVIAIMGEPQDYRLDDEEPKAQSSQHTQKSKKLYRDTEEGILGGVLAGLSHYLGIDKVWVRIIFILLVVFYGTGILIYIILWIIMPEAKTTSEKLEMKGEAVNISNIEKKVRKEFENISEKVNNIDYEKYKNQAQSSAKNVGDSIGNFFLGVFKIIGKLIGVFIILFSVTALASLLIALFTLGSTEFFQLSWMGVSEAFNYSEVPIWNLVILFFLAIGIPFFALLILGFKILIPNSKSFGRVFNYSMFGVWIISIIALIILGVKQATEMAFEEKTSQTQIVDVQPNDTLFVNLHSNTANKGTYKFSDFKLILDEKNNEVIYSNQVKIYLYPTKEAQPYVVINKKAEGNSLINAKNRAEQIRYNFEINHNQLVFDDYLISDLKNKFRGQKVHIEVFIPEHQPVYIDEGFTNYWYAIQVENTSGITSIKAGHYYLFDKSTFKCIDCLEKDFQWQESTLSNDTIQTSTEKNRLQIGKDGTIIKQQ